MTKSGSLTVTVTEESSAGNTITLRTSDDVIGYQAAYYSVQSYHRTGVRIRFTVAENVKNGLTTTAPMPLVSLFQLPSHNKYVRLLYVTRKSRTDHDMAVLAAGNLLLLAGLTSDVQSNPVLCRSTHRVSCSWVPAGVAVRPEFKKTINGNEQWVPAR